MAQMYHDLDHLDHVLAYRYDTLCKSRVMPTPPGEHVCNSCVKQSTIYKIMHIIGGQGSLTYPDRSR